MIESVQLIATYACTLLLLGIAPRLLFILMCFAAGYPFLGIAAVFVLVLAYLVSPK